MYIYQNVTKFRKTLMIFNNFYQRLQRITTVKNLLILFLITHLVLMMMMIFTFPKIQSIVGTRVFDLRTFGYSQDTAKHILSNLNQEAIDLYLFPQLLLLDVLYPFFLALFLSLMINRLFIINKVKIKGLGRLFVLMPYIGMLFDYLENGLIITMILNKDQVSAGLIALSSVCTLLKSMVTILSWLVIIVLTINWLKRKLAFKNKQISRS